MASAETPGSGLPKPAFSQAILDLVLTVPPTAEPALPLPAKRAQSISRSAARKASVLSGSLALPPGVLGWLTVLPELVGVWKLQAQMVSDIAGVYGKQSALGREHMLYCLFKHVAAQLFRDVVVRVGERVVVQQTTVKVLQTLAQQLGIRVAQMALHKGVARFVPLAGAVGVGAYAYFDTLQVAKTAVELFEREMVIDAEPSKTPKP